MGLLHIAFYPSDWLAGTRGLTDAETGVYITLIARMYEMAGPIEHNDERLFRLCGSKTKASFKKSLKHLVAEGKVIVTLDGLFNERVEKEINIAITKSGKAKIAADARWRKKPNINKGGNDANASREQMPHLCQLEPEPELYKKENTNVFLANQSPAIDECTEAIRRFNAIAEKVGWPKVQKLTPPRRAALLGRLKDVGGLDGWTEAIGRASAAPHLIGQNNRQWVASFDWLTNPANFTKLMEGNYDPSTKNAHGIGAGSKNDERSNALANEIAAAARAR